MSITGRTARRAFTLLVLLMVSANPCRAGLEAAPEDPTIEPVECAYGMLAAGVVAAPDPVPLTAPLILRRYELPLETHLRVPVHLDGAEVMQGGGLRLQLSRRADPSIFEHAVRDRWTIDINPDGSAASLESLPATAGIRLTTGALPGDPTGYLFLVARSEGSDTLWTCPLECDEFCHSAFVTAAEGGGWLASIHPDCSADCAPVYRISGSGESVFSTLLHHHSLLGLPETEGEIAPSFHSQEVISSDDILLTGQVHEWMTTPGAWFVCMLDGATGELLWTATGFGAGDAEIADAIELPDGRILAAGSTRDWDESSPIRYGAPHPFLLMFDPSGRVLDSLILDDSPGGFHSLIAHPAGCDRFFVALCGGDGEDLALLEMTIPVDRDSWNSPGAGGSGS